MFPDQELSGWKSARRGLGRLQFAALLVMIPLILECVLTVVSIRMSNGDIEAPAGFLKEVAFFEEYDLATPNMYTDILNIAEYVGFGLGALLGLFGFMACAGIPGKTAFSKGAAGWATLLTLLAIGGYGLMAAEHRWYKEIDEISAWFPVQAIGVHLFFIGGLLANLLILHFVSQTGTYLGDRKAATGPRGFLLLLGFWVLLWYIGRNYLQILLNQQIPEVMDYEGFLIRDSGDSLDRSIVTAVIMALGIFMLGLSYIGMMDRLRRAITKRLPKD